MIAAGTVRFALSYSTFPAWDLIAIFHYDNEIPVDYDLFEKTSTPGDHKWVVVVLRKRHSTIAHF